MESFESMLLVGGHANSLGRAGEVLEIVRNDQARMDELFDCVFADDAWVRMRAIDTFEKLVREDPARALPYVDDIFSRLLTSTQPSIQWHLAQLFTEIQLDDNQRLIAIRWLQDRIATTDVDWIVSADAMKSLLYFYRKGSTSAETLRPLFEIQRNHASKAVRKKADTLLKELA